MVNWWSVVGRERQWLEMHYCVLRLVCYWNCSQTYSSPSPVSVRQTSSGRSAFHLFFSSAHSLSVCVCVSLLLLIFAGVVQWSRWSQAAHRLSAECKQIIAGQWSWLPPPHAVSDRLRVVHCGWEPTGRGHIPGGGRSLLPA